MLFGSSLQLPAIAAVSNRDKDVGSSSHFINYIDPTTHYATVDPGPIYSLADDTELVRRTAVS
jgi:hypothetical protein